MRLIENLLWAGAGVTVGFVLAHTFDRKISLLAQIEYLLEVVQGQNPAQILNDFDELMSKIPARGDLPDWEVMPEEAIA